MRLRYRYTHTVLWRLFCYISIPIFQSHSLDLNLHRFRSYCCVSVSFSPDQTLCGRRTILVSMSSTQDAHIILTMQQQVFSLSIESKRQWSNRMSKDIERQGGYGNNSDFKCHGAILFSAAAVSHKVCVCVSKKCHENRKGHANEVQNEEKVDGEKDTEGRANDREMEREGEGQGGGASVEGSKKILLPPHILTHELLTCATMIKLPNVNKMKIYSRVILYDVRACV